MLTHTALLEVMDKQWSLFTVWSVFGGFGVFGFALSRYGRGYALVALLAVGIAAAAQAQRNA